MISESAIGDCLEFWMKSPHLDCAAVQIRIAELQDAKSIIAARRFAASVLGKPFANDSNLKATIAKYHIALNQTYPAA